MAESENPAPEENNPQEEPAAPRVKAGQLLAEARARAGVTIAKVSADLRISSATLEALEAGDYAKLAGAPYIRALLVSLSRYLRLDSKDVLNAYSQETGGQVGTTVPVSPYKDDSKTHAKAHKQIFILLLVVLLFILLLIMGKVSSSSPEVREPEAPAGASDTLLNINPPEESDSLAIDSLATDSAADSAAARIDTASAAPKPADAPAVVEEDEAAAAPSPTVVRISALSDSVYIRVLPAHRRESSRVLVPGQSFEVRHNDAITFITRNSGTVEVTVDGNVVVPDKRRFKVDGATVTY